MNKFYENIDKNKQKGQEKETYEMQIYDIISFTCFVYPHQIIWCPPTIVLFALLWRVVFCLCHFFLSTKIT